MRELVYVLYDYEGLYAVCGSQRVAERAREDALERTAKYTGNPTQYHRFKIVPTLMSEDEISEYLD